MPLTATEADMAGLLQGLVKSERPGKYVADIEIGKKTPVEREGLS